MRFNSTGTLLACQSADTTIEIISVHNEEQINKKRKRRRTKEKKKAAANAEDNNNNNNNSNNDTTTSDILFASDEYSLQQIVVASGKIKSFAFFTKGSTNQVSISIYLYLTSLLLSFSSSLFF